MAVLLGVAFVTGNGTATIVAPAKSTLKVELDGKVAAELKPGQYRQLKLDQGKHDVTLTDASGQKTEHHIQVKNGAYDAVLPTVNQCFAVFDVTNLVYEKVKLTQKLASPVELKSRHMDRKEFDLPAGAYLSMGDIPSQIKTNQRVQVLRELPCQSADKTDDVLVRTASF